LITDAEWAGRAIFAAPLASAHGVDYGRIRGVLHELRSGTPWLDRQPNTALHDRLNPAQSLGVGRAVLS